MGKIYLIGAGPGDPDLLTVKAARILGVADVVLHDALVSPAILALIAPNADVIDIGKRCGHKLLTQAEINSLLVQYAQKASVVVRLKGGDPTIFGRAGEEIAALNEADVEFEIVSGVTTALAAAASAKISLTDRRFASSVTLMTAHRGRAEDAVEWDRLVTSGSTIAIYMPGTDYHAISAQLRSAGLPAETPAILISHVALPEEQKLYTTLEYLAGSAALQAPSLLIVGRCACPLQPAEAEAIDQFIDHHQPEPTRKEIA